MASPYLGKKKFADASQRGKKKRYNIKQIVSVHIASTFSHVCILYALTKSICVSFTPKIVVLVLSGTEFIFCLGIVLCFGIRMRTILITH